MHITVVPVARLILLPDFLAKHVVHLVLARAVSIQILQHESPLTIVLLLMYASHFSLSWLMSSGTASQFMPYFSSLVHYQTFSASSHNFTSMAGSAKFKRV